MFSYFMVPVCVADDTKVMGEFLSMIRTKNAVEDNSGMMYVGLPVCWIS